MHARAPHGSIIRTPGPREDLLTFDIVGKIPAPDMAWMASQVDAAFATFDAVDMLLIMRRFEGAELGALVDPEVAKVQFRSLRKVRRYAVVGAPGWARVMIEIMDGAVPVKAKTFDRNEEQDARWWVDGPSSSVSGN